MRRGWPDLRIPGLFLLLLFFLCCGPSPRFNRPQPAGNPDLEVFPAAFRGLFLKEGFSGRDVEWIYVSERFIHIVRRVVVTSYQSDSILIPEFDSTDPSIDSYYYSDNKMYVIVDRRIERLKRESGIYFYPDRKRVVRQEGNLLFLSTRRDDDEWSVQVLELVPTGILVREVRDWAEMDQLREKVYGRDTLAMEFDPGKEELLEFIREGGFGTREAYFRWPLEGH